MTLSRVVFLSAPPLGEEMMCWLMEQPCEIVICDEVLHRTMQDCSGDGGYDLGLNFLGSHKIPPEHCSKFVNFHPAPLPEYAGRNVAYHAIMNGELSFGATCHYMTEEYDAGDIIEVMRYPVEKSDTAGDLVRKSRQCCVELFKKWVPELLKGKEEKCKDCGGTGGFGGKSEMGLAYKCSICKGTGLIRSRVPATPQDRSKRRYYYREQLKDRVAIAPYQEREILALICPPHYPYVVAGGKKYKLVPMEEWGTNAK